MCDEDEAKIRQILIAAPLDYNPTIEKINQVTPKQPVCSIVA